MPQCSVAQLPRDTLCGVWVLATASSNGTSLSSTLERRKERRKHKLGHVAEWGVNGHSSVLHCVLSSEYPSSVCRKRKGWFTKATVVVLLIMGLFTHEELRHRTSLKRSRASMISTEVRPQHLEIHALLPHSVRVPWL